jgi:hypothetical protein
MTIIGIRRGNMFSLYSGGLIVAALLLAILHDLIKLPLRALFNPISLIPISIVGIGFLFGFLKYIDIKPMIIIDDKGVLIRKSRFPFSRLEHLDWNDIKDYSAKVRRFRHGTTKFLVIKRKSTGKKYYVDLFDLKTDTGDVLAALRRNLQKHKQDSTIL